MLLHCWWDCKLIQPLWKTVWSFLEKLGLKPACDPAIPVLGIYTEESKIEKDSCIPLFIAAFIHLMRWMNLEPIWNLEKCYWRIYLQGSNGETDIERKGKGEMYGKSNMETYITICKIDSQLEFVIWLRKLKQGRSINLEGWERDWNEREVQKEVIYVYHGWFMLGFDRKQQHSVKQLSFNDK